MKNLVFVCASLGLGVKGQIDGGECTYAVELLQLQDGSFSFQTHIESMTQFMAELVDTLHERYGEFKYGVSSFVDKPIPYSGYGSFGGWQGWVQDYCYRHHAPLAEDASTVVQGLTELVRNLGAGNDFPENPLEALMYAAADTEARWSPVEKTHSEGGRPIVRIAMVITDDIPHAPRDAYSNTQLGWNWPRSYPNGPNGRSTGGFGAHSFAGSVQINVNGDNEALYREMADLFGIFDNEGILTSEEEARLDELVNIFGPYPWPAPESEHPGDLSLNCAEVEYPTAEQVGDFLRPLNVLPIFLVAKPESVAKPLRDACNSLGFNPGTETTACLVEYYKQNATQMNLPAVVAAIDGDNTLDVIVDAVGTLTDLLCLMPTTTTTTTVTTPLITTLLPTEIPSTENDSDAKSTTEGEQDANNVTTHLGGDGNTDDIGVTTGDGEVTEPVNGGPDESDGDHDVTTQLGQTDDNHHNDSSTHSRTSGDGDSDSDVTTEVDGGNNNQDTEGPLATEPFPSEGVDERTTVTEAVLTEPVTNEREPDVEPTTKEVSGTDAEQVEGTEGGVTTKEAEPSVNQTTKEAEATDGEAKATDGEAKATDGEGGATDGEGEEVSATDTEDDATTLTPSLTEVTSSTEEELVVVVPPVVPPVEPPVSGGNEDGDGPSVGVIAGAAGGAVAGVAVLAGLAYAKFGAGMFGGSAPAGLEGIQQVEVPDSPIERETMEEVTMDMFQ